MRGCANRVPQQNRATAQSDHFMGNIIADVVRLKPEIPTNVEAAKAASAYPVVSADHYMLIPHSAAHQRHEGRSRRNPGSGPTHASEKSAGEAPKSAAAHRAAACRRPAAGGAFFRTVDRVSERPAVVASTPARHRHSTICSVLLKQP